MKKPAALRAYLLQRSPWLQNDPTRLATFVENGHMEFRGDDSSNLMPGRPPAPLCYEHHYILTLVVMDYPGVAEDILVPIMEWLSTNQPDLLHNPDWQKNGLTFDAEVIDKHKSDLSVSLKLSERVIAHVIDDSQAHSAKRYRIEVAGEPQFADLHKAITGFDVGNDPALN